MPRVTHLLLSLFIVWRVAAAFPHVADEVAQFDLATRARLLTTPEEERLAATFAADAPLWRALREHAADAPAVVLYHGDGRPTIPERDELVCRWQQFRSYFFPTRVTLMCGAEHPILPRASLPPGLLVASRTPDIPFPMQERFDVIAQGPGFALFAARAAPSR